MRMNKYFDSTIDTWNETPSANFTLEELNYRLQCQNALIGAMGEFMEVTNIFNIITEGEEVSKYKDTIIDETGDLLYYVTMGFRLFFNLNKYKTHIVINKELVTSLEDVIQQIRFSCTTVNFLLLNRYFNNIKKPIFRTNKDFDLEFIELYFCSLLDFICGICVLMDISIEELADNNYAKLHDSDNLLQRGLKLNEPESV